MRIPAALLAAEARSLGFEVVGATAADPLPRDWAAFMAWLDAGRGAGLGYMSSRTEARGDPRTLLPGALSVVTVAVAYGTEEAPDADRTEGRFGRVARYAWGLDYHDVVPPRLEALARHLEDRLGRPLRARAVCDAEPILERGLAARAGLGIVGKSTNLLLPRGGSWWLLGELLLDAEVEPLGPPPGVSCGTCRTCLDACPTGAFPAPYVLDAPRCISYLTIENRGEIPRDLRSRVGPWVFGCDVCQEVCPFNRFVPRDAWPELSSAMGVGPRLDLPETLAIRDDASFRARFRGTPLKHAKRRGLLRNAAVVARNVDAAVAVPALLACVERDPDGLVRGHALWALEGLAPERARALADRLRTADPDPFVRAEAAAAVSCLARNG
jgi:epoxyqueuosine reductase